MKKFMSTFALGLFFISHAANAAWDFRGEPNDWGQTRMTQVGPNHWEITQEFTFDQDEFKIARDDGWVVSFPEQNFVVEPGDTYLIEFFDDSNTINVTPLADTIVWNFRGTPNGWTETPMESVGNGMHRTCQEFAGGDESGGPRFKIARSDWDFSFPADDFGVTANTFQEITFNENDNSVIATPVSSCGGTIDAKWMFRGTPNGWTETPLVDLGNGLFEICQAFANGDDAGGPRFKIASAEFGWDVSFPSADVFVASNQDVRITFDENTSAITTENVALCNIPDGLAIIGQKPRFTLVDVPFVMTPDMVEVSGASEFNLAVFSGENYFVDGNKVIPNPGFTGELNVVVNVSTDTETSNNFNFGLPVMDLNIDRSLIVHTQPILSSPAADISLVRLFNQLAAESNEPGLTGVQLFRQFWDVQNTPTEISVGPNCGDETLADGTTPALNGFPVVCDRQEGAKVQAPDADVLLEMESYFPIAAVNRFDLRRDDFSDCGEHRMIFARGTSNGSGRNFIITEARVANPIPGDPAGCQPLVNFWLSLNTMGDDDVARAIEQTYFDGFENFPPVMSIAHFAEGAGQIRTNQFITFQWLLREYKLENTCGDSCVLRALPVTVKENPFGQLFNGNEPGSGSEFADRASSFQADFLANLGSLTNNNIAELTIRTADQFNNGQSHASGNTIENDFDFHFNNGSGSDFFNQLNNAVEGSLDANGNPLTAVQILNRATALTCGGCHQPSTFGLTATNAIGAMRLPNGDIIDSWPFSNFFVHVSEFPNFEGEFDLSDALDNVFLPVREDVLTNYLIDLAQ